MGRISVVIPTLHGADGKIVSHRTKCEVISLKVGEFYDRKSDSIVEILEFNDIPVRSDVSLKNDADKTKLER